MGRYSRYRTIARIALYTGPLAVHAEPTCREARIAPGISLAVANRRMYQLLRVAPRARSRQRRKPWPVADQRNRSPVGERIAAYTELAVLSSSRLPDQQPRNRLVGVEYGRPLLAMLGQKDGAPKGSTEQGARGKHTS
jgi:hypothetical protein